MRLCRIDLRSHVCCISCRESNGCVEVADLLHREEEYLRVVQNERLLRSPCPSFLQILQGNTKLPRSFKILVSKTEREVQHFPDPGYWKLTWHQYHQGLLLSRKNAWSSCQIW